METRIGFKVVNQKLESYVAPRSTKVGRKYSTKRWTLPIHKELPLMVFATEKDARDFLRFEQDFLRLFRCEYVPSDYTIIDHLHVENSVKAMLEELENLRDVYDGCVSVYENWPNGTVFASRVRLIEEIKV